MSLLFASLATALAAVPVGEQMTWEVRYGSVLAGTATAHSEEATGHAVRWVGRLRSAEWFRHLYVLDDRVESVAVPGVGSRHYLTRYREGGFVQDQDMYLDEAPIRVFRRQLDDGAWREWWSEEPAEPGAEDPLSGMVRVRHLQGEGPWSFEVFSGRHAWPAKVELVEHTVLEDTVLGEVSVRVHALDTSHEGDVAQKGDFLVYVTDDARRIPVRSVVKTSVGTFRAELVEYVPPTPAPGP